MHEQINRACRQAGVSPKVVADAIVSIVGFAVTYFAVDLDPVIAAAIAKAAGTMAAWLVGPGHVVVQVKDAGSDELLEPAVRERL